MTNIYGDFNGDMLKAQKRQAAALENIAEHLEKISMVLGRATENPDTDDKEDLPDGVGYDLRRGWADHGQAFTHEAQLDVVEFLHDTTKLGDKSVGLKLGWLYVEYKGWAVRSHKGLVSVNEFRRILKHYYAVEVQTEAYTGSMEEYVMGLVQK